MAYEQGDLSPRDSLQLFSDLVKSGDAWRLQGCYGRTAKDLIDSGLLDSKGNIDQAKLEERLEGSED